MRPGKEPSPRSASCRDDLRRSKPTTRHAVRKSKSKVAKKSHAKVGKRSTKKKNESKLAKVTKLGKNDKADESKSSVFSGEPLKPDELQQLLVKFKKDGNFRCRTTNVSSAPVAMRTKNVRSVAKRKGCNEETLVTGKKTSRVEDAERDHISSDGMVPLGMTSLNPLPIATGSTLQINMNNAQYLPSYRLNGDNGWNEPTICRNLLSSGSFRERNGMDFYCYENPFAPTASYGPYEFSLTANPFRQQMNDPNENRKPDNEYVSRTSRISFDNDKLQVSGNDSSTGVRIRRSNHENFENCKKLRSTEAHNNAHTNLNEAGNTTDPSYGGQMNTGNSTFGTPNECSYENSTNLWNTAGPTLPKSFATEHLSMHHPIVSQNSMNCMPSDFGYYTGNASSNDLYNSHGFGGAGDSGIDCNNSNARYFMTCDSRNTFSNAYSTADDPCVNVNGDWSILPAVPSMISNESDKQFQHTNCWLGDNFSNGESILNNDNERNSSIVTSNFVNLPPLATTTMINESTEDTTMNINDKTDFLSSDFSDIQNRIFYPTVSSIDSYDDDIAYENYVIDANPVLPASTGYYESNSDSLAVMEAEVRPLYDASTNYSQYNNDWRFTDEASVFYNFDTKEKMTNSPNCVIFQQISRA